MTRVLSIFVMCFYLMGCNDKDSSELDVDSELRLEVSVSHFLSDGDFVTNYKSASITVRLFEDQYDKLKVLKANRHIAVKEKGEFFLHIDGARYDLSDYYQSSSTVISDSSGKYSIELEDYQQDIQNLSISFTFDGGTYTSDIELPAPIVVENFTDVQENYAPLIDDIHVAWNNLSLPANITSSRHVFLEGASQGCASENIEHNLTEDETFYIIQPSSYVFDCYDGTQEVNRVKSNLTIVQDKTDVEASYVGFYDMSVGYSQTYFWSSEDDL